MRPQIGYDAGMRSPHVLISGASIAGPMGTSLALVGAYVLAGELTARDDHREAFARFEATMRPYVDRAQKPPPVTPRIAFPRTRTGVTGLRTALRVAASPVGQRLGGLSGRFFSPPAGEIDLPRYPVYSGTDRVRPDARTVRRS